MATKKTTKVAARKTVTKAPAKKAAATIARGESAVRESVKKKATKKQAGLTTAADVDHRIASGGTVKPIGPKGPGPSALKDLKRSS